MGDLALTSMGLGDKAAAFKLIERAMAVIPIEKDAVWGPIPIEILARVAARWENPTAPSPRYRNYSRYRTMARWLKTCRLLLRCSGSIQCSIRFGMIRASKNSAEEKNTEENTCQCRLHPM